LLMGSLHSRHSLVAWSNMNEERVKPPPQKEKREQNKLTQFIELEEEDYEDLWAWSTKRKV